MKTAKIQQLVDYVCDYSGITSSELMQNLKSKESRYIIVRHRIFWILRRMVKEGKLNASLADIGKLFNKDHATVIHAYKNYPNLWLTDPNEKTFAMNTYEAAIEDGKLSKMLYEISCIKSGAIEYSI